jgi:hypothetical protein
MNKGTVFRGAFSFFREGILQVNRTSEMRDPSGFLPGRNQRTRLAELEATIERGLTTFVAVGLALTEIQEKQLYRGDFETFEEYCLKRWAIKRAHAYRLINAAEVVGALSPMGDIPKGEREARELVTLLKRAGPDAVRQAWAELREEHGDNITAEKVRMAVHYSSASSDWYTPPEVIDRVVKLFGRIELDPCSNSREHPNVPALVHLVPADNGLSQPWHGTVYMNPPYGREIEPWVSKLVAEHACGNVSEAVALVPARVDTGWFRQFADYPVCFVNGRLKFSAQRKEAPFPSAVCYLGPAIDRFFDCFSDLGDVRPAVLRGV